MYPRRSRRYMFPREITFQTELCLFFPTLFLITARCEEICLYMPHRKTKKTSLYYSLFYTNTLSKRSLANDTQHVHCPKLHFRIAGFIWNRVQNCQGPTKIHMPVETPKYNRFYRWNIYQGKFIWLQDWKQPYLNQITPLMDCRDVKLPLINKRYKVEFLDRTTCNVWWPKSQNFLFNVAKILTLWRNLKFRNFVDKY